MGINGIVNGAHRDLVTRMTERAAQLDIARGTMTSGRPSETLVQAIRVSREGIAAAGLGDGHAGVALLRAAMDNAATSPASHAATGKLASTMAGFAHILAGLPRV